MADKKTIISFCAAEQKDTDQTLTVDGNGEIVLTCTSNVGTEEAPQECGRFIKYPRGTDAEALKSHIVAHRQANLGQISVAELEAQEATLLEQLQPSPEPEQL